MEPLVSVVIATYDRPAVIPLCLEALKYQVNVPHELIVVDTSPNDLTERLIHTRYPYVRYWHLAPRNANAAEQRNIGIRAALGNIVAFLDDDGIPQTNWLSALVACYQDAKIGGVGGRVIERLGFDRAADREPTTEYRIGHVDREHYWIQSNFWAVCPQPITVDWLRGCNMSFRREVLLEIGGFDSGYTGEPAWEETDVCLRVRRAGYRILYNSDATVFHLSAPRPRYERSGHDFKTRIYRERNRTYYMLKEFGLAHIILRFLLKEPYWALLRRDIEFLWRLLPRWMAVGRYLWQRLQQNIFK